MRYFNGQNSIPGFDQIIRNDGFNTAIRRFYLYTVEIDFLIIIGNASDPKRISILVIEIEVECVIDRSQIYVGRLRTDKAEVEPITFAYSIPYTIYKQSAIPGSAYQIKELD